PDFRFVAQREEIDIGPFPRERPDGERRHEFRGAAGHDATDEDTPLAQPANEVERLVGGDPSGNDKQDAFAPYHVAVRPWPFTAFPLLGENHQKPHSKTVE